MYISLVINNGETATAQIKVICNVKRFVIRVDWINYWSFSELSIQEEIVASVKINIHKWEKEIIEIANWRQK